MDDNKVLETNVDLIYEMYRNYYSKRYTNFNIYLEKLLSRKEIIKSEYANALKKNGDFLLNISDIDHNIVEIPVEDIKKNYLNLEQQDNFILKTDKIDPIKARTVLYIMFINEYIITFSDYGGYYNIIKYKAEDFK
ncbi:hypothetical protein CRN76_13815 [Chryseobacterium indologenes]|uniref:hypothetical protein n=1 Tax=Chryseobacterium indologenes TaxID=253 RepID=UPI000BFCA6DD|nr:hypothetical protein [Chryseobacterium indologenes]ATN06400.1 hypothetical protein CRN76_13815 [Chryseobacterium indologenes]AYY84839.1 hypothetical protein EGX91_09910 [Chryseobacterium indologenes]QIX81723.1 hypothetical protein FOB56_10965 [Chryseobacterium indologenes]UDQ55489.1 hypothetical protein LJF28_07425 [Chryseobacterium indologenes]